MGKRKIFIVGMSLIIMVLVTVTFISAGFFDFLKKVGLSPTQQAELNITVGNTPPEVIFVDNSFSPVTVNEDNFVSVVFSFHARDLNGVGTLNDATATARFNRSGEVTRFNSSCETIGNLDSTTRNYSCTINVWYFDEPGIWSINATIADNVGAFGENITTSITINSLTAIQMSPTEMLWDPLIVTSTNQTANENLTINNTGNADNLGLSITAIDLTGETTPTEYIYAGNFSVDIDTGGPLCSGVTCLECDGTQMVNETLTAVTGSNLPNGNYSEGFGIAQETLHFCIKAIGIISSQAYSTEGGGTWTVQA